MCATSRDAKPTMRRSEVCDNWRADSAGGQGTGKTNYCRPSYLQDKQRRAASNTGNRFS